MKTQPSSFILSLPIILISAFLFSTPVQAASATLTLSPVNYVTQRGADGGQDASVMATQDQSGTDDNPAAYLGLETPGNKKYRGYRIYVVPDNIDLSTLSALQVDVNYLGPKRGTQKWTWRVYDWKNNKWVSLGNNEEATAWQWSGLVFGKTGSVKKYVNKNTREIWIRVHSSSKSNDAALDYEAVTLTYDDGGSAAQPSQPLPPPLLPPPSSLPKPSRDDTIHILSPTSYLTQSGVDGGQDASVMATQDQSGADNNPTAYLGLETPGSENYQGYRVYVVPETLDLSTIIALQVNVNTLGPKREDQQWTWKVYDWNNNQWVVLGDNGAATAWQWSALKFSASGTTMNYVNQNTREVWIQVQSSNTNNDAALDYEAVILSYDDGSNGGDIWQPTPGTSWQWQLSGTIDTSIDVDMYDIDLFDVPQSTIDTLHNDGRIVICYFSAGSWEDWREDAGDFPASVKGTKMDGWNELWLDISNLESLTPIMAARLDLAAAKGCDGVEPDNVDGYSNNTGFGLSYADQIAYNTWLANAAHARGLSIGLKNDLDQIPDLVTIFDWAINEECFEFNECETLLPFVQAGKAVFGVEYNLGTSSFCPQANAMNFDFLKKRLDLNVWRSACR